MRFQLIFLFILFVGYGQAQVKSLEFTVIDKVSNLPIENARVFIDNSTFGSISDKRGKGQFDIPSDVAKELVVSHVSYDLMVLQHSNYKVLKANDTIFLMPNATSPNDEKIDGTLAMQWKKDYRKFSKAFIGSGKRSALCEIKNPEVLRFTADDGIFKATAIDILKIKNYYLGYDVDFLLEELTISKDGAMIYSGYPKYNDRSLTNNRVELEENRKEAFEKSISHFLLNLITENLSDAEYGIKIKQNIGTEFTTVSDPKAKELVLLDSLSGFYNVLYNDYLEVKHLGIKNKSIGMSVGGSKSSVFGNNNQEGSSRISYPTSMLYKDSPSLIVDKYGQILNPEKVQKYGYWAEQKITDLLPLDYGFTMGVKLDKEEVAQESERIPVIELDTTSVSITHTLLYGDNEARKSMLDYIDRTWKESYIPLLLDINYTVTKKELNTGIIEILASKVEIFNYVDGLRWMWSGKPVYDEFYLDNKAEIYQHADPVFRSFFHGQQETAKISIDEIVWGGVEHNSIPSLRMPKMLNANEADYLDEDDVVFGIVINGEAKAYPKRILGWHEFFLDKIGDKNVAGVYCTLCGTMIAYDMHHRNVIHDLGTSGFLYMSNKLMYDRQTRSLWSTIDGEPVLGPLTRKGIKLNSFPVVTTKWKNWKADHPETKVLDIDTGFERNYNEGEAYKSYFAHDRLMFPVLKKDDRLANKAEVLIIRSPRFKTDPLAISIKYLKKKKLHQNTIADKNVLVITEKDGASKVYYSKNIKFKSYKKGLLTDMKKKVWTVTDDHLISDKGRKLLRVPSHNSFWFLWFNMYPKTRLVK